MRINGKEIQGVIRGEVREAIARNQRSLHLVVISAGDDPVIRNFINIKKRFAADVGVVFSERSFPKDASLTQIEETLRELNDDPAITGIIVQLPLPSHLDTDVVLASIAPTKDVDVLSLGTYTLFQEGSSAIFPPVTGAIAEICVRHKIVIENHHVVILGNGRLVGAPAAVWFRAQGGRVTVFDKLNPPSPADISSADIIVCGMGQAGYIKPDMVKKGVVLLDAGTSESRGVIVGDVDPRCEEIASIFTPVPGGIGPITVAMIFRNLLTLNNAISKESLQPRNHATRT